MSRRDFYDDPAAPSAQKIVPAVSVFVVNDKSEVLLERRSDNGRWGMPGGVQEIGESVTQAAVREVHEETGIEIEVTDLVGIYTDPGHVIAFSDGEVRQEFSLCFRARATGGEIKVSSESHDVRWFSTGDLDSLNTSRSTQRRIADALAAEGRPVLA